MRIISRIWHDPVGSKVISVAIIALLSYLVSSYLPAAKDFFLIPIPLWGVCVFSVSIYYLTKISIYHSKQERYERNEKERKSKAQQNSWQQNKDAIWSAFIGLDNNDMQKLLELYNSEVIDPDNENVRMVRELESYSYQTIIDKTSVPVANISSYRQQYLVCILPKKIGDKIYYTFDQYFFSLLMYYAISGEKKKL